jgi:hypothetical protein
MKSYFWTPCAPGTDGKKLTNIQISQNEDNLLSYWQTFFDVSYFFLLTPHTFSRDTGTGAYFIRTSRWRKVKL